MIPNELVVYVLCGVGAGLMGGLLGVGGGVVLVPLMAVFGGIGVREAVPVSLTAIVASSFAASNSYLKKGMVDLELTVIIALVMVMGNITGSYLSTVVPSDVTRLALTAVLLFTAVQLLVGTGSQSVSTFKRIRHDRYPLCAVLALFIGALAGLIGIGGGELLVPLLFLVGGVSLSTARGTSSLVIGFSAAAACAVYFLNDRINLSILPPVVFGMIVGAKLGSILGTRARPWMVKTLYVAVAIYLSQRLSWHVIEAWW